MRQVRAKICEKMNTIKTKEFSVIGHSLGSLILYDLLSSDNSVSLTKKFNNIKENFKKFSFFKLEFRFEHFFAIGSPISYFLTINILI